MVCDASRALLLGVFSFECLLKTDAIVLNMSTHANTRRNGKTSSKIPTMSSSRREIAGRRSNWPAPLHLRIINTREAFGEGCVRPLHSRKADHGRSIRPRIACCPRSIAVGAAALLSPPGAIASNRIRCSGEVVWADSGSLGGMRFLLLGTEERRTLAVWIQAEFERS
jgi:hypothetical protein